MLLELFRWLAASLVGRQPTVACFYGVLLWAAGCRGCVACCWNGFGDARPPWPAGSLCWPASVGAGPLMVKFWYLPCSVDLRLLSSQADSPCLARSGALDGLTVVATLAHELF